MCRLLRLVQVHSLSKFALSCQNSRCFFFPLLWKPIECALDFYCLESSRTLPQRQYREAGRQGIIIVLKMAALLFHFPVVLQITVSSWWLLVSPLSPRSIVLSGRPCLVASVILIFKPEREKTGHWLSQLIGGKETTANLCAFLNCRFHYCSLSQIVLGCGKVACEKA